MNLYVLYVLYVVLITPSRAKAHKSWNHISVSWPAYLSSQKCLKVRAMAPQKRHGKNHNFRYETRFLKHKTENAPKSNSNLPISLSLPQKNRERRISDDNSRSTAPPVGFPGSRSTAWSLISSVVLHASTARSKWSMVLLTLRFSSFENVGTLGCWLVCSASKED